MTKNQIEFLKHLETKRNNQAQEIELNRANLERERQGQVALDETSRHNLATEQHNANVLDETKRSNLAREAETARHNYASELETSRHNQASERMAEISFAETQRANLAREQLTAEANRETARSNQAREAETARSNRATEQWRSASLAETTRSNIAREEYNLQTLAEQQRMNTATIDYRNAQLEETHRSNVANEVLYGAANVTKAGELAERVRSDLAREAETATHNRAMEIAYAAKDYSTRLTVSNDANNSSVNSNSSAKQSLPGNTVTTPKLESGSNPSSTGKTPVLLTTERYPVYSGIISEVAGLATGSSVRVVRERYSDGSSRYFQEVINHGKITERKQISESQFEQARRG